VWIIAIIILIILGVIVFKAFQRSFKVGVAIVLIYVVAFVALVLYIFNRDFNALVRMTFSPQEYHWSGIEVAHREWSSFTLPLPPNTAIWSRRSSTNAMYTTRTDAEKILEFYSGIADEGTFFVEHVENEWYHLRIIFRIDGKYVSILLMSGRLYERFDIDATTNEEMADRRLNGLLRGIEWQSIEGIRTSFSNTAINEATDFVGGRDYLFELFQGNIVSREIDKWQLETVVENGQISELLLSWYTVTTDEDKYLFFIADFISDTINPDNRGIYALRVVRVEDVDTHMLADWREMLIPGIYIPREQP